MERLGFGQKIAFLANLGVIAGIALLAYEMRQNTVAIRSTASQGVQDWFKKAHSMRIALTVGG